MLRFSIKGSKLFVIFILTVIVSGSILTYLSITNISNYRELLEKKISEEERDVTIRFASDFQKKFQSLTIKLSDYVLNADSLGLDSLIEVESVIGIVDYVVIDKNGGFIFPYFINDAMPSAQVKPSYKYSDDLRAAENNEFVTLNFKSAERKYLSAIKVSLSKLDSAYVYNALARLYVKMDRNEEAFVLHQIIVEKFKNTLNASGFPFVYFSIIKQLKINDPSNAVPLQNLLQVFLKDLSEGIIPLNESTEELLDAITLWQNKYPDTPNKDEIEVLIALNRGRLQLINNYKTPIETFLKREKSDYNLKKELAYISIKSIRDNPNEIMLFFTDETISVGYVIGLQSLFIDVIQSQASNFTTFEYNLNLIDKTEDNFLDNTALITLSEFSPYFENSLIQVALKDGDIIHTMVLKRKLIYGFGLFIFLGIMVFGLYLLKQDLQREQKMHKLRSEFVSNVTHELKTPLTSIYMFAEALNMKGDNLDPKQKKYTTIIVKESEKLKRMINNILEFSRTESNKLAYKLEVSNLTDIVNASLKEMNYFLEIHNFEVNLKLEKEVFAKVDPEGIKQALSNLISNAIKYSPVHRKLNVRMFKKEANVFIEVEDFGKGIPSDKLELIFEKFYRVQSIKNETISGTGLGLTVTKDIIEEQGGTLLVESRLGKGSTFTIVLNAM